jgi:hypothetical protein
VESEHQTRVQELAQADVAKQGEFEHRIVSLESSLRQAREDTNQANEVRLEADRRRTEMAEAVESSKYFADKEIQKLKQVVVTLKRSLDKERKARKSAEVAAEDARKGAAQARLAAEPRIAAWRAAQAGADPETEVEIEVEVEDED